MNGRSQSQINITQNSLDPTMNNSAILTTDGSTTVSIIANWIEDDGFAATLLRDELEPRQRDLKIDLRRLGLRLFALTVSVVAVFQFLLLINRTT